MHQNVLHDKNDEISLLVRLRWIINGLKSERVIFTVLFYSLSLLLVKEKFSFIELK